MRPEAYGPGAKIFPGTYPLTGIAPTFIVPCGECVDAAPGQRAGATRVSGSSAEKLAPDWHQPTPESKKVSRR